MAISDTHGFHRDVVIPDGDVLVHAGDITMNGEVETILDFVRWLVELPHAHKVIVPGNHDRCLDHAYPFPFPNRVEATIGCGVVLSMKL